MKKNKTEDAVRCEEQEQKPDEARPKHHWRLIGAVGLLLAATAVIANLHDIKRYIRISTM